MFIQHGAPFPRKGGNVQAGQVILVGLKRFGGSQFRPLAVSPALPPFRAHDVPICIRSPVTVDSDVAGAPSFVQRVSTPVKRQIELSFFR
jgi:hypothetical protein